VTLPRYWDDPCACDRAEYRLAGVCCPACENEKPDLALVKQAEIEGEEVRHELARERVADWWDGIDRLMTKERA
jgi:hypothetical protein